MALHDSIGEVQVLGRDQVDRVKSLIHEGNVQGTIVKDEHGNTFYLNACGEVYSCRGAGGTETTGSRREKD